MKRKIVDKVGKNRERKYVKTLLKNGELSRRTARRREEWSASDQEEWSARDDRSLVGEVRRREVARRGQTARSGRSMGISFGGERMGWVERQ